MSKTNVSTCFYYSLQNLTFIFVILFAFTNINRYICNVILKYIKMKLSEAIKNNPYLKAVNCTDIDDINCGIKAVFELERVFGRKKVLDNLFEKLHDKKEKMKNEKN